MEINSSSPVVSNTIDANTFDEIIAKHNFTLKVGETVGHTFFVSLAGVFVKDKSVAQLHHTLFGQGQDIAEAKASYLSRLMSCESVVIMESPHLQKEVKVSDLI